MQAGEEGTCTAQRLDSLISTEQLLVGKPLHFSLQGQWADEYLTPGLRPLVEAGHQIAVLIGPVKTWTWGHQFLGHLGRQWEEVREGDGDLRNLWLC